MMAEQFRGRTHIPSADALIAISRTRELTADESRRLENALRISSARGGQPKGQRIWTRGDDRRLLDMLTRGKKPKDICIILNRTERAVWRRIYRKGWAVRLAPKSSIARGKRDVGE